MKKYLVLIGGIIAAFSGSAQKITFSNFNLKGKNGLKIVGKTENGFYLTKTTEEDDINTEYFEIDEQYNPKESKKIKDAINSWKETLLDQIIYDDKLTFLVSTRKDKIYNLTLKHPFIDGSKMIDLSSNKNSYGLEDDFTNAQRYFIATNRVYNATENINKKRYLITGNKFSGKEGESGQFIIDDKYNILAKDIKPFIPQTDNDLKLISNYFPFDDYVVAFNKYSQKVNKNIKSSLNFYNYTANSNTLINIPEIPGHYYLTEQFYLEPNRSIEMIGLYNDVSDKKNASNAKGFYKYVLNPASNTIILSKTIPLSQSGLDAFEKIANSKGKVQSFTNIFKMNDGSYVIVGEFLDPQKTKITLSVGGGISADETDEKYYNIFVVGFDKEGNFKWAENISRKETISGSRTSFLGPLRVGYGSFALLKTKEVIHLFYNDDDKVIDYTLNSNGESKKNFVPFDEKDNIVIFPKDAYQLDNTSILFPCLKKGKSEIVKLEY